MKKILYILTSLILLLPNISFGQTFNTCSEFIQNYDTITFIVGDSSYYTVEAEETQQEVVPSSVRQLSLERPSGGQVSIGNWAGSGRVLLTQNGIFSNTGTAQYIIRSYQTTCNTNIIILNVTVMNPTLTFCSQPAITTTQTTYPVGNNLSLGVFRFASEEEGSTDSRNLLYSNIIYPNGDTTSLTEYTSSDDEILSVKNNLSLADSGWYYIRFRQNGCPTKLDSINLSILDTNLSGSCSKPVIATNKGRYEKLEPVKIPILREASAGTPNTNLLTVITKYGNIFNRTNVKRWSTNKLSDTINLFKPKSARGITEKDTGFFYVQFIQPGCPTTTDSIRITLKDTNHYTKNIKYYIPIEEFLDYKTWKFKGDGDSTNWTTSENFKKIYSQYYYTDETYLMHYRQNLSDTALSPIFYNTGYANVKLSFDLAHTLKLHNNVSSYDTLIINALYNGSTTPTTIYKKGGYNLRTTVRNDSLYFPANSLTSEWRKETINLTQCDTASSIKFQIILKEPTVMVGYTKPSNAIFIKNFSLIGAMSIDSLKLPTLTLDSLINNDTVSYLNISFPNNHKAKSFTIYYDDEYQSGTQTKYELVNKLEDVTIKDNRLNFILKVMGSENDKLLNKYNRYPKKMTKGIENLFVYKDTTKNRETYPDTAFNIPMVRYPKGKYKFYCLVKALGTEKYSDTVTLIQNYVEPELAYGKLTVDSTFNKDKNYKLYLNLPLNHEAKQYEIYMGNSVRFVGSLNNNRDTVIIFNLTNIPNGTYTHRAKLINLEKETLKETISNSLSVVVNTKSNIGLPTLLVDSTNNRDKNYNISISIPANNDGIEYGLIENNVTIETIKIATNNKTSLKNSFPIANKANGTYTYTAYIKNNNTIAKSQPLTVTVNYTIPSALACTTDVITASDKTRTNFTYSFKLTNNCTNTGYKAVFYTSNSANGFLSNNSSLTESQVKLLSWTPANGTPRNGVGTSGNIQLTQSEIKLGYFNRKANPALSYGNRWYRVDIICTTCSQPIKTRTQYFYVTN